MRSCKDNITLFGLFFFTLLISLPSRATGAGYVEPAPGNVIKYRLRIVSSSAHNSSSFTQGLFFYNGKLYETTGQYGKSKFLKVDLKTGNSAKSVSFPDKYFAEGSAVLNGKAYILTWMERVVFVYDIETFKPINTLFNPREGWGLTTDGNELIMSDGSDKIYFMEPGQFREKRAIRVTHNGKSVNQLNELEYIRGDIWANVYGEDLIYIINPKNGEVKGLIDCKNLLPARERNSEMVLNGIAFEPLSGKIFLTGKLWPRLYQVELVR